MLEKPKIRPPSHFWACIWAVYQCKLLSFHTVSPYLRLQPHSHSSWASSSRGLHKRLGEPHFSSRNTCRQRAVLEKVCRPVPAVKVHASRRSNTRDKIQHPFKVWRNLLQLLKARYCIFCDASTYAVYASSPRGVSLAGAMLPNYDLSAAGASYGMLALWHGGPFQSWRSTARRHGFEDRFSAHNLGVRSSDSEPSCMYISSDDQFYCL